MTKTTGSINQVFLGCIAIFTFTVIIKITYLNNNFRTVKPERNLISHESITCYRIQQNSMPDISNIRPRKGKSIFFLETSCHSYINDKIVVTFRQACAVESAARANPNFDVYLLFTSPGTIKFQNTTSDRSLNAILTYKNVKIHHVNYENYTKYTPLEKLYKSKQVELSNYSIFQASDVLRFLTLWKYGGIYLDLDVVVLKSLESLPSNYAGFETATSISSAVLSFAPTGLGHHIADLCLKSIENDFRNQWAYNGPALITRLMQNACGLNISNLQSALYSNCSEFKVYPSETFFPISYHNWTLYYNATFNNKIFKIIKNSHVTHIWNGYTKNVKLNVNADVPYTIIVRKYCPKVVSECADFF